MNMAASSCACTPLSCYAWRGVNNSLVGPNCTPDVMLHNHSHTHSAAELCSEALGGRKFFGSRFSPPSASTIQRYYVEEQTGWRSARLRPGDVVFDLGPHNGFFTMKAAERVGPTGIVVAVEASRTNYEQIQKMIECNGLRNVRLVYGAVYSVDGEELRLHSQFNYDKRGEVSVGNTVHPDWTRKDGSHPAGLSSNASSFNTVSSVTVDALVERFALKRVDAIFCTINGIEMDALIGASKTLARYRPDVALADRYRQRAAANGTTLQGWLEANAGYTFFRHFDLKLSDGRNMLSHGHYDNGTLYASSRRDYLPPDYV